MTSPENRSCDLCGDGQFELIGELDRKGRPLRTVVCRTCGLVSHERIPTEEELAAFYRERYREEYQGESSPSARRVMRAWKNARRIHGQLRAFLRPRARVLEIGAGIGCTVKFLEQCGYDAWGIEAHRGFCRYGRERLHARLCESLVAELPSHTSADTVLLVHVIEHFRSPCGVLRRVRQWLPPNGLLYVECPNLAAPFALRSKMFHMAHIHNFTPRTLAMIARRCGFQVECVFSRQDDPNLQMLFRTSRESHDSIDPHSYRETMQALGRYDVFSYHLRWCYLRERFRKLTSYAIEHLTAGWYVRRLLQGIAAAEAAQSRDREPRAA